MNLADILNIGRAGLSVDLKGSCAASDDCLRNGNPGIVVAEDTCILLVARRVGGNFSKVQIISGVSGLVEAERDILNVTIH